MVFPRPLSPTIKYTSLLANAPSYEFVDEDIKGQELKGEVLGIGVHKLGMASATCIPSVYVYLRTRGRVSDAAEDVSSGLHTGL